MKTIHQQAIRLMAVLLLCFVTSGLSAQKDFVSAIVEKGNYLLPQAQLGNLPALDDNELYQIKATRSYYDIIIPENTAQTRLYLKAVGGDGGYKKASSSATGKRWGGGKGATTEAVFEIGTAEGQIPPGAKVRFIVGSQGKSIASTGNSGGGGGGGTGILFKGPNASQWQFLLVAGGGGGGAGDCCTIGWEGGAGREYVSGDPNKDDEPTQTMDWDHDGASCIGGVNDSEYDMVAWRDYPTGDPTGADNQDGGGWGFGPGGDYACCDAWSGGGGGFKGGLRGNITGKISEGGTSYVNEKEMTVVQWSSKRNGTTKHPEDGYAWFQFYTPVHMTDLALTSGSSSLTVATQFDYEGSMKRSVSLNGLTIPVADAEVEQTTLTSPGTYNLLYGAEEVAFKLDQIKLIVNYQPGVGALAVVETAEIQAAHANQSDGAVTVQAAGTVPVRYSLTTPTGMTVSLTQNELNTTTQTNTTGVFTGLPAGKYKVEVALQDASISIAPISFVVTVPEQ